MGNASVLSSRPRGGSDEFVGAIELEARVVWADLPGEDRTSAPVQHGLRLTSLSWTTPLVLGLVLADPPH